MTAAVPTPEEWIAQWRELEKKHADKATRHVSSQWLYGEEMRTSRAYKRCADELESSLQAHGNQIAALKKDLEEAAALGAAACTLLTRILEAERVIPRAEAERDARDFLAGRAVQRTEPTAGEPK